jgi:uncharacterized protein (DUF697 family)
MTTTSPEATEATDAELTPEQRHAEAERLVQNYSLGGTAIGLVPIPLVDMAGLVAIQLKMLHALARVYGVNFRADLGRSALASLFGGVLPASILAPSLAASLGKLIPGAGQLLGTGTQVVVGGAVTYAVGKVFIQHFASGGTFLTFDPEAVRDYFQQQLEIGKTKAANRQGKGSPAAPKPAAPNPAAPHKDQVVTATTEH